MIGTFFVYLKKEKICNACIPEFKYDEQTQLHKDFSGDCCYACFHITKKFADEKIFLYADNLLICFDGIILNLSTLLEKHHCASLHQVLTKAVRNKSLSALLNEFRGSFTGVIYDFINDEIIAFTDQLATKLLFYYKDDNYVILSTEVKSITEFLRQNHVKYSLDMIGAYSMITYAYMYGDYTLIHEIKRLKEGMILRHNNGKLKIEQYYRLKNEPVNISEEEAVQKIEEKFTEALKLQVEMNKKHALEDAIPLSAGMDCRMTSYVYRDLFNKPAINFTYSETGEADFETPSKMAADLKNRWIFKNLDNGNDLFEIEKAIEISDGMVYYAWPAQLYDFLRLVDTRNWGIIHTGVIGDIVIGTFKKDNQFKDYFIGAGAYSVKLINKLKKYIGNIPVVDYELGMISNRGINGACIGYSLTFRQVSEDMSPFMNLDFLEFCLSIPFQMRQRHKLYYKWVKQYHLDAAKFKHNGITIEGKHTIRFHGKDYRLRALPDLIRLRFRQKFDDHYGMNPIQGWYNQNNNLRNRMDTYFEKNKYVLQSWKDLYSDTVNLYNTGTALEKIQAISLVGSVKMLFGK